MAPASAAPRLERDRVRILAAISWVLNSPVTPVTTVAASVLGRAGPRAPRART